MSEKGDKPVNWHQIDPTEVLEKLQSSDMGLVSEEARRRLEFRHRHLPLMAVQYHPEASSRPRDAGYIVRRISPNGRQL